MWRGRKHRCVTETHPHPGLLGHHPTPRESLCTARAPGPLAHSPGPLLLSPLWPQPACLSSFPQYVPEDLLPVYREKVVPVADIITPNQFEAE